MFRPSGLGGPDPTCSSPQFAQFFSLGIALGRASARQGGKLAEGEFTAPVLIELAASKMSICRYPNAVAAS